ncbi:Hydrogenase transcriptional regulatory protein hupR1 [Posidoniimonas polymericola]|uniref:Hydrogenase transcriptional regulatory protein hupR1 n=1 Tax=Posidoniimonas polymericola TaxID=2528002 RepID=A0A5C5YU18_9BACT|nr:response regulator [Posidoniimonas polymericola]TWT78183.1 Hydrogenase transcriptional regulatory protein hupR1 [Posidoniimonas polymericola]
MGYRVMLVDDDHTLLSSIGRNLCLDYDLVTACSGAEALEKITEHGPFGLVLTDMRMPGMTGLQLIIEARKVSPMTSYIMLTGNQDLGTAVQAVNEGHVFRFLSKPCELATIRSAIEAGLRQYGLEVGEKELLNKTCAGAIALLTDVLEATQPMICSRHSSTSETVEMLLEAAGVPKRWEYALASRLALVGFACLGEESARVFDTTSPHDADWKFAVERAMGIGGRMVKRIPRLGIVGEIVESAHGVTGAFCYKKPKSEAAIVRTGATLIALSLAWETLRRQGLRRKDAVEEMKLLFPELLPVYVEAFEKLPETGDADEQPGAQVDVSELAPGMVLHSDVVGRDGSVLLRAGSRLSEVHIEKLRNGTEHFGGTRPIMIVEATAHAVA